MRAAFSWPVSKWEVRACDDGLSVEFAGGAGMTESAGIGISWRGEAAAAGQGSACAAQVLTAEAWRQTGQPLRLPAVFPGIDVVVHGQQGVAEFDFHVAPGADPRQIAYRFDEGSTVNLLPTGQLLVERDGRHFTQRPPLAWQDADGVRVHVPVAFRLSATGEVGFALGAYRADLPLVIDPTVEFATYVGKDGNSWVSPHQIAVAPNGDIFVLTLGSPASIPNAGTAYRPYPELPENVVLLRIRGDNYQLISRTSLPLDTHHDTQWPLLLAVDETGAPWVAIHMRSTRTPALNPSIGTVSPTQGFGVRKALLMRLTPDASAVSYSAYVGCNNDVTLQSLDAGKANRVVLGGITSCSNFPASPNVFGSNGAPIVGLRAFALALNANAGTLAHSGSFFPLDTQVGGDVLARVDSTGRTVLVIRTTRDGYPTTPGALYSARPGNQAVYLAALSPNGEQLEMGTYFGSGGWTDATSAVIGPQDSLYLSGQPGDAFPLTPGAFRASAELRTTNRYIARIRKDGALLESSAIVYVDANHGSSPTHMAVMDNGDAVFVAPTLPEGAALSVDAFTGPRVWFRANHAYLARLSADGTTLRFSSGLPSMSGLRPDGLAVTASGRVLISGVSKKNAMPRSANAWADYPDATIAENASPGFLMAVDLLAPTSCTFGAQLSPHPVGSGRQPGTLNVTAQPGCPWVVSPVGDERITFSGFPAGLGNGTAPFITEPNLSQSPASFSLWVGKSSFPFTQSAGECSFFEVDPLSLSVGPAALWSEVRVRTPSGCPWTPSSNSLWFVNADSTPGSPFLPQTYTGGMNFSIRVFANAFDTRSGSVTLGPKTFSITQSGGGCTATITPASLSFPVAGGDASLSLQTTGTNCEWIGVGGPGVNFPQGRTGTGSATIPVNFAPNPSNTPRESFILLANKRIPITQGAGQCTASFPSTVVEAPQVGGHLMIPFTATGNSCGWNVGVNQPWLRWIGGTSSGSGDVALELDPNPSLAVRQATVTNLGQSVTVRQLGTNTALLSIHGPGDFWVKINGVKEVKPPPRSYPIGTSLTLEPQEMGMMGADVIFQTLGWEDLAQLNRTVVLNTNSLRLDLRTQRLFRLAQEKVAGGGIDLVLAGLPSPYPEFYGQDPGFHTLIWEARPKPDPGFRFVGWLLNDLQTYWATDWRWYGDGRGPFLRPRYEPVTPPTTPHFMPASLELTTYPEGDEIATSVEFRTAGAGLATLQPESCTPNFAAVRLLAFTNISGGYRLRIGMNHEALKQAGKGTVECSIPVRMNASGAVHTLPLKIRVEGVPAAAAPPPVTGIAAVTNAATFAAAPLAPGGLFTLFGQNMANATAQASTIPLPQLLANVQVWLYSEVDFAVRIADLLYVSPTQINFHVPADLPAGGARIRLIVNGNQMNEVPAQVAQSSPGIFRVDVGGGQFAPAGYGTLVSGANQQPRPIYNCPAGQTCALEVLNMGGASDQLFLSLYGTGLRLLAMQSLTITANGITLPVEYLGAHSYFVGLDQINVRVPPSLRNAGVVPLELRVGGVTVGAGRVRF